MVIYLRKKDCMLLAGSNMLGKVFHEDKGSLLPASIQIHWLYQYNQKGGVGSI